jgi:long-subunit fatty acid transport protein
MLCLSVDPVHAADKRGTTGAQVLQIAPDARSAAMGGTYVAIADDIHCLHYNPAGLGTIMYNEFPFSDIQLSEGVHLQYAGIAYSLRDARAANVNELGAVAAAYTSLDSGDIVGRNIAGAATGSFKVKNQMVTLGYGKPILQSETLGSVKAGVVTNLIGEKISDSEFNNIAFDAGALWQLPSQSLSLGLAFQNIGNSASYAAEKFDLPATVRAGIAYRTLNDAFLLGFDIVSPSYSSTGYSIGGELALTKALVLRGGYQSLADQGTGVSTGVGIVLKQASYMFLFAQEIRIDYAFVPYGDLGDTHRLTLLLKLGAD